MRAVVGTAGHIDHGKTTLLRALTGIDADRLPEEQRRGMTIDVGYAHLDAADGEGDGDGEGEGEGEGVDFVDVPGHDRLVSNMLVGVGEIDAALLVIAADDGPRPQTLEHLELLDALGVTRGIVAVTKADVVDEATAAERTVEAAELIAPTRLAGSPILAVSALSGTGLGELRSEILALSATVAAAVRARSPRGVRLAVDRAFGVRGRGAVVTGSLRGGAIERNTVLRLEPGGREVRVREVQVHGRRVERVERGGRVALNLASVDVADLRRGQVLAAPGVVVTTRRLLVALEPALDLATGSRRDLPRHGDHVRLHLGTEQADAIVVRNERTSAALPQGAVSALLRLDRPIAASFGDAFVLRRPSPGQAAAGGRVLDPLPPLGVSRRRATTHALTAVATSASPVETALALVALHGAVPAARLGILLGDDGTARGGTDRLGPLLVHRSLVEEAEQVAIEAVGAHAAAEPLAGGLPLGTLRAMLARDLRRRATIDPGHAAGAGTALVDRLVARGALLATGDRVRVPGQASTLPPDVLEAMERVEAALSTAAPPPLSDVVRAAACPPEGLRALEAADRIVRLAPEIAYARPTYARLAALALRLATARPLSPAAFRDATGTSRKYALAVLEDLDRRGLLQRTDDGHVPGPRAPRSATMAS